MKSFSLFQRLTIALLATLVFDFVLMQSNYGMQIPMPILNIHQVIQLLVPAVFFFVALRPSSVLLRIQGKMRIVAIGSLSLVLAVVSEVAILMMFALVWS